VSSWLEEAGLQVAHLSDDQVRELGGEVTEAAMPGIRSRARDMPNGRWSCEVALPSMADDNAVPTGSAVKRTQSRRLPRCRRLIFALVLLSGGSLLQMPAFASSRAADGERCRSAGHVLARGPQAVVWQVTVDAKKRLYACAPAVGADHLVSVANQSVAGVVASGSYVGFTDHHHENEDEVHLDVFDVLTGHTELDHDIGSYNNLASPGGSDTGGGGANPWWLAPNGWVVQSDEQSEYPSAFPGDSEGGGLIATDGRHTATDLDNEATKPRLRGSTLTWEIGDTSYAAPVGSQLEALGAADAPPPTTAPNTCALLAAADAQAVLGTVTSTSASTSCTYVTGGSQASTLTVGLQTGLTSTQVSAAERAAYHAESYYYTSSPDYGTHTWTALWDTARVGLGSSHVERFVGNTQLTLEVATADPSGVLDPVVASTLQWTTDDAVMHFTDLAFDRLMGWPVRYVSG
jgi:hypothetical protein